MKCEQPLFALQLNHFWAIRLKSNSLHLVNMAMSRLVIQTFAPLSIFDRRRRRHQHCCFHIQTNNSEIVIRKLMMFPRNVGKKYDNFMQLWWCSTRFIYSVHTSSRLICCLSLPLHLQSNIHDNHDRWSAFRLCRFDLNLYGNFPVSNWSEHNFSMEPCARIIGFVCWQHVTPSNIMYICTQSLRIFTHL